MSERDFWSRYPNHEPGKRTPQKTHSYLSEQSEEVFEAPSRVQGLQALASSMGNRAFTQLVGRSHGDGISPEGNALPEVKTMIESRGGKGQKLDTSVRQRFGEALGDSLEDVTVHTDHTADALCRSVNANAFALRTSPTTRDVFFGKDTFSPGTRSGDRLLGEELAHLTQQKNAAMTPELKISDPDSPLEREAQSFGEQIADRSLSRSVPEQVTDGGEQSLQRDSIFSKLTPSKKKPEATAILNKAGGGLSPDDKKTILTTLFDGPPEHTREKNIQVLRAFAGKERFITQYCSEFGKGGGAAKFAADVLTFGTGGNKAEIYGRDALAALQSASTYLAVKMLLSERRELTGNEMLFGKP